LLWTGTGWGATGLVTASAGSTSAAWFDPSDSSLSGAMGASVWKQVGTTSSVIVPPLPTSAGGIAYDASHDQIVFVADGGGGTWRLDSAWHPATATAPSLLSLGYDPVANVVVGYDTNARTWLYSADWQVQSEIAGISVNETIGPIAYDYGRGTIVLATDKTIYALRPGGTAWQPIVSLTNSTFGMQSLVYDRGAGDLVGLVNDGVVVDLVGSEWLGQISFGSGYAAVADYARDSVVMVTTEGYVGNGVSNPLDWERLDKVWSEVASAPLEGNPPFGATQTIALQRSYGRIDVEMSPQDGSILLLERQWKGSTPDETCVAGVDADGDGLAGCDDPDCWWACHPACPYRATCP